MREGISAFGLDKGKDGKEEEIPDRIKKKIGEGISAFGLDLRER
jgi:hypothetical protein